MHLGPPLPSFIFAKGFVILCVDGSGLSGRGRVGLLSACWKEKIPCVSSHLGTPSPNHKGRRLVDRPMKWTRELALGRAAGWGWGQETGKLGPLHHFWQEAQSTELLFAW